jgi:hypothetical protein
MATLTISKTPTDLSLSPEQLQYQQRSARLAQARYDSVLQPLGLRAPEPTLGAHPDDYRREMMRALKVTYLPRDHPLYKMTMRQLPSGVVLDNFEEQLLAEIPIQARNPNNIPQGELREFKTKSDRGAYGVVDANEFVGSGSFVTMPNFGVPGPLTFGGGAIPGRRLTSWRLADQGYLRADGRPIELQRHRP